MMLSACHVYVTIGYVFKIKELYLFFLCMRCPEKKLRGDIKC